MSYEIIAVILIAVGIGAAYLFFILARRVLKLAIRLVLAMAIILVVTIAAVWFGWFSSASKSSSPQQNRPANTKRGNSR